MREDWIECRLDQVSEINPKLENKSEIDGELEIQFLPMRLVEAENNITHNIETRKFKEVQKKSYTYFEEADILFAKVTPCMENGKIAIASNLKNNVGYGSSEFHVFRASKLIFKELLFYFLVQKDFRRNAQHAMTGAVGLRRVPKKYLENHSIPLPPLVEQKAIVKKIEELFSSLDSGIADLKKAQEQLKIYRQAVLKKAFEGLSEIALESLVISSQNGMSKRSGKEGSEIKVLRLADITNLKIDNNSPRTILLTEKEFLKYGLKKGDLLIIRVNGSIDLVGRMIEVGKKDELEKWAFCDHLIRLKLNNEKCVASFYFYFFQLPKIRKYIHQNMVSSAGQNTVSQGTVKSISVPLCGIDEQHQIVQEIESRLSVCDKVEKDIADSLEKAQALRQSILKKAFEGKLLSEEEIAACKAHSEYEPASVLLGRIKEKKATNQKKKK